MKKKLQPKVNQIETLKPLYQIAKIFEASLTLQFSNKAYSWAIPSQSKIWIPLDSSDPDNFQLVYSLFFHELAHILNYRDGIFKTFHGDCKTKRDVIITKRTALRAEIYTDKRGQQLMKQFFPELTYIKSYRNKKERDFLKDFCNKQYHGHKIL